MSKKLSIIVPVYNMATEGKLNYSFLSPAGNTAGVSFCPRAAVKPDAEVNVSGAESVYIVK